MPTRPWIAIGGAGAVGPVGPAGGSSALALTFIGGPATQNSSYSASLVATGGTSPYTYSISVGSLPTGLSLNTSTGTITGTPTVLGTFTFTGKVVDAATSSQTVSCTITVGVGSVSPAPSVVGCTSATLLTQAQGNGTQFSFSSTLTLPATYAQISYIIVYAVSPTGLRTQIGYLNGFTGTTVSFSGTFSYSMLMSNSSQSGWDILFISYNSVGNPTLPGVLYSTLISSPPTTITVPALSVAPPTGADCSTLSIGNADYATRWIDTSQQTHAPLVAYILPTYSGTVAIWSVGSKSGTIGHGWFQVTGGIFNSIHIGWNGDQKTNFFAPTSGTDSVKFYVMPLNAAAQAWIPGQALPGGATAGSSFNVARVAPSATGATLTCTNIAGSAPTVSNIYMGLNGLGNPYWQVNLTLTTPGQTDPNTWFYAVWVEWQNSGGSPISPGGISNSQGWVANNQIPNTGDTYQWELAGNYPGPGIDGYMQISVWAVSRAATTSIAPYTGDAYAVLQSSSTNFEIGPPQTGNSSNMLINPNFANGLVGWTQSGSAIFAPYTSGGITYGQAVAVSSSTATISQKFAVRANDSYVFELWVQSSGSITGSFVVEINWLNSSGSAVGTPATLDISFLISGTLNPFSISGTVPSGAVTMVAEFVLTAVTGTVIFTNGYLAPSNASTLVRSGNQYSVNTTLLQNGPNQLINPGFETGDQTAWSTVTTAGIVHYRVTNSQARSGNYSFEAYSLSSGTGYLYPTVSNQISAGAPYTFTVYILGAPSNAVAVSLVAQWYDITGSQIGSDVVVATSASPQATSWTVLTGTATAPLSPTPAVTVIYNVKFSGASGSVYVDDCSLSPAGANYVSIGGSGSYYAIGPQFAAVSSQLGLNTIVDFGSVTQVFRYGAASNFLKLGGSGIVLGDNYTTPVNTVTIAAGGITIANGTSGPSVQITGSGMGIYQSGTSTSAPNVQFNASYMTLSDGAGNIVFIGSGGTAIKIYNGSGVSNYVLINSSGFTAYGNASNYVTVSSSGVTIVGGTLTSPTINGGAISGATATLNSNGITTSINNGTVAAIGSGCSVLSTDNSSSEYLGVSPFGVGQFTSGGVAGFILLTYGSSHSKNMATLILGNFTDSITVELVPVSYTTAGSASGKYLGVYVAGSLYKLSLLNP